MMIQYRYRGMSTLYNDTVGTSEDAMVRLEEDFCCKNNLFENKIHEANIVQEQRFVESFAV